MFRTTVMQSAGRLRRLVPSRKAYFRLNLVPFLNYRKNVAFNTTTTTTTTTSIASNGAWCWYQVPCVFEFGNFNGATRVISIPSARIIDQDKEETSVDERVDHQTIPFVSSTSSSSSSSQTREELERETAHVVRRIKAKDKKLDVEYCYDLMEDWLDEASLGSSRQARVNGLEAAKQSHRILQALQDNRVWDGNDIQDTILIPPRVTFYEVVLQAYAVSGAGKEAADVAENILDSMIHDCRRFLQQQQQQENPIIEVRPISRFWGRRIPCEPSIKAFNIVMNAWAKSGVHDAGKRAEAVLSKMELWKQECSNTDDNPFYVGCEPNPFTWMSIMDAWARRSTIESRTRVVEILHLIKTTHDKAIQEQQGKRKDEKSGAVPSELGMEPKDINQNLVIKPIICNIALKVFVDPKLGREGAVQAEKIVQFYKKWHDMDWSVEAPDIRSYTLVMDAWAQCCTEEGATRAQGILDTMIRMYYQNMAKELPNHVSFAICISAWAKLAPIRAEAPEKAEQLLMRMMALYEDTGDEAVKPTAEACNCCIAAWCRCTQRTDSMDRALLVLDKVKHYAQSDVVSYNTWIDGYSKRGRGSDALDLLTWLESPETPLEPDILSYNTALAAISRDPNLGPKDALAVLDRMQSPSSVVRPDRNTYTALLTCWANQTKITIQEAKQAAALVKYMQQEGQRSSSSSSSLLKPQTGREKHNYGLEPDAFLYSVLIRVCAKVQGTREEKLEALEIALATMTLLVKKQGGHESLKHVHYHAIMRAVVQLCENQAERLRLLVSFFQPCSEHGHVSHGVLSCMLETGALQASGIVPESWYRNVPLSLRPRPRMQQKQQR